MGKVMEMVEKKVRIKLARLFYGTTTQTSVTGLKKHGYIKL
jgi:hypothetical protein